MNTNAYDDNHNDDDNNGNTIRLHNLLMYKIIIIPTGIPVYGIFGYIHASKIYQHEQRQEQEQEETTTTNEQMTA